MVHFDECCVLGGSYGGSVHPMKDMFIPSYSRVTQVWTLENNGRDPPHFGVIKTQTWAIVRVTYLHRITIYDCVMTNI